MMDIRGRIVAQVAICLVSLLPGAVGQGCETEPDSIDTMLAAWPGHRQLMTRAIEERGEKGAQELVAAIGDSSKPLGLRCTAIQVAGELDLGEAAEAILGALAGPPHLQCCAIPALTRWRDPRSVPALVRFLDDRKSCGEMRQITTSSDKVRKTEHFASDAAVEALERITGLSFETEKDLFVIGHRATRPWNEWWAKNADAYSLSPLKFIPPARATSSSKTSYPCSVDKIALSPDGTRIASGSKTYDGKLRVWDLSTAKQLWASVAHANDVTAVAFSPDAKTIASSSSDGSLMIWEAATGRRLKLLLDEDGFDSVVFSPNGSLLAAAGDHGLIRFWSTRDWCRVRDLQNDGMTEGIAFSPDGKFLAAATFERVRLWDVIAGAEVRSLRVRVGVPPRFFADGWERDAQLWRMAWSVAFSPDGRLLATGSSGAVQVWEVSSGREVAWKPSRGQVAGLTFTLDGQWVVWGNRNDEIWFWDLRKGTTRRIKNHIGMGDLAVTPDNRQVLSPGVGSKIEAFDFRTRRQTGELTCSQ